jgi:TPR repeat protein
MIARVVRTLVVCFVLMGVAPSVVGQGLEDSALARQRDAAAQGDPAAQTALGMRYHNGDGVPQNYAEAIKWYRKAADQGDTDAQILVGQMYYKGEGVPQDYAETAKWYRKAADRGRAGAQAILGILYEDGHGVPQDYVQAHLWYNLAGASGDATSAKFRDLVAAKMTPAQIAEAQKLAREWRPKKP